jgi:hypothetical protein
MLQLNVATHQNAFVNEPLSMQGHLRSVVPAAGSPNNARTPSATPTPPRLDRTSLESARSNAVLWYLIANPSRKSQTPTAIKNSKPPMISRTLGAERIAPELSCERAKQERMQSIRNP